MLSGSGSKHEAVENQYSFWYLSFVYQYLEGMAAQSICYSCAQSLFIHMPRASLLPLAVVSPFVQTSRSWTALPLMITSFFCRGEKALWAVIHRMLWVGRELCRSCSPTPLQWTGTSATRSRCCSEPCPDWPWMSRGQGHPPLLWATCASASLPLTVKKKQTKTIVPYIQFKSPLF